MLLDQLDLEAAIRNGSRPNDLLPPRHEDKVIGEVGKRFLESIRVRLDHANYDPLPASIVHVPKPGHTTRPAALLTLTDRVVYDALVAALRPRIESSLLGKEIVFWPRGTQIPKEWSRFEKSPLRAGKKYIVHADISGFYETIDHQRLGEQLTDSTGKRDVVEALIGFLGRVMQSNKGLPQGLEASDALATVFLLPIDAAMTRTCLHYYRHGDDIRIATDEYGEAREALFLLEQGLRNRGLLLNNPKSSISKATNYRMNLRQRQIIIEKTRKSLLRARIQSLHDEDELIDVLRKADREDLGWEFIYHGRISFEEVIDELKEHLTPDDVDVAAEMFKDTIKNFDAGPEREKKEEFHHRITWSLLCLIAAKSNAAVPYLASLLGLSPEKTEFVVGYVKSLSKRDRKYCIAQFHKLLGERRFHTPWEKAWFLHLFWSCADSTPTWVKTYAMSIAEDESEAPICRAEAAKVLGKAKCLEHRLVTRLWNVLPSCFRADLVAAVFYLSEQEHWAKAFLDGAREDPIHVVVLRHLESS